MSRSVTLRSAMSCSSGTRTMQHNAAMVRRAPARPARRLPVSDHAPRRRARGLDASAARPPARCGRTRAPSGGWSTSTSWRCWHPWPCCPPTAGTQETHTHGREWCRRGATTLQEDQIATAMHCAAAAPHLCERLRGRVEAQSGLHELIREIACSQHDHRDEHVRVSGDGGRKRGRGAHTGAAWSRKALQPVGMDCAGCQLAIDGDGASDYRRLQCASCLVRRKVFGQVGGVGVREGACSG